MGPKLGGIVLVFQPFMSRFPVLPMRTLSSSRLILWTGPKHSGKTTTLSSLIYLARLKGVSVAGILAPSFYIDDKLVGFDIVDLQSSERCPLARLDAQGTQKIGDFVLRQEGIELGRSAMQRACSSTAALIIVDEYGPLELKGGGWRSQVDEVIAKQVGIILLVVRDELADQVAQLYSQTAVQVVPCHRPGAIERVIAMLTEDL